MKKIFCLLTVSLLALTSCSSEEDTPTPIIDNDVFLKKTIEMDMDSVFVTTTFNYDLDSINKLTSVLSDNPLEMDVYVTYTGDLITKMIYKRNDSIKQTTHYEYDFDNKLVSFLKLNPVDSLGYKEIYTYDAPSGAISINSFTGNLETQTTPKGTGAVYFINGEVTQINTNYTPTYNYSYDTQKNPLKNVLGLAKISFMSKSIKSFSFFSL